MKTIIRKSLLVALMFGTLTSYATGTTFTERNSIEEKVTLSNVKKGQRWFIKSSKGKVIHEEIIKSNGSYNKDFDFASLENGYYTLEVNKDFQIDISPFTIVSNEVIFHKEAEKTIFKPVVRTDKNRVLISKLDFETNALRVVIYYENEIIFKETVKGGDVLRRIYALQENKKGDYKVIMKANDRTYINEFSL
jgi:hypothetical protein